MHPRHRQAPLQGARPASPDGRSQASLVRVRAFLLVAAAAAALLAPAAASPGPARGAAACPAAWAPGWQKLADRIHAPVYCPSWMPSPLDAKIGGVFGDGYSVKGDRSYWVSFLSHDQGDVHVNFRGYPGRTKVPICHESRVEGGRTTRYTIPCFSQPHGTVRVGAIRATLYTVNQDADQWHLLYAWRYRGSLYTVSQHTMTPYTGARLEQSLLKVLRSLVLVQPRAK